MELFKINQLRQYKFIQIPKELIYSPRYKNLSSDAKLVYGLLLDRMELSKVNNWINKNNEIYLIFTRESIQNILGISDKTCTKAFKQLNQVELIKEVKQGLGKPNIIFVGHIVYDYHESAEISQNRKKYDSVIVENTIQEADNLRANKTNINKTNFNLEEEESTQWIGIDQDVIINYKKCISKKISNRELQIISELQDLVGKELLNKAILLATIKNGKNLAYIQAILNDWNRNGFKTIEQVNIHLDNWAAKNKKNKEERKRQSKKKIENKNNNPKTGMFNNYEQRTYDFDKLERQLLGWND